MVNKEVMVSLRNTLGLNSTVLGFSIGLWPMYSLIL